jgi:type IV secretion system protein TrbG
MRSSSTVIAATFAASASALFGQSAAAPPSSSLTTPVEVKRVAGATRPGEVKPVSTGTSSASGNGPAVVDSGVPKDYRPKDDIALTPNAVEAVRVSTQWQGEKNAPAAGPDGRVMYSFGAGLPTVVCAPLRVCMIELQAGERVLGEPQIGDSVRWNISPAMYGTGEETTPVIVLKPQTPGLDTNLLVTTDRRAYYLRLISKADDYVARVAFAYPDDDSSQKWQKQLLLNAL